MEIDKIVDKAVRYAQNHGSNNPLRLAAEMAIKFYQEETTPDNGKDGR